ncbi:MAG: periplasmic heavy metal sensor [Pseudomonadota bacterium]|nr:periplasmic heavy metal sensor [Pseudomonadota bacterium]
MSTLILTLLLSAVSPAHADDTMGAANALASGRFEAIAEQLKLSATQRASVSDAVYQANAAKIDIEARSEKGRLEVKHLLAAATLDEKAVLKATDTLSAAEADLRKNRVQLVIAVRKALTPEQWQALVAIRQEHKAARRAERDEDEDE